MNNILKIIHRPYYVQLHVENTPLSTELKIVSTKALASP